MDNVEVVTGPTAPDAQVIFQVTLPSGAVLTRPYGFEPDVELVQRSPLVAHNGELLVATH